jgi:hypothetical protein
MKLNKVLYGNFALCVLVCIDKTPTYPWFFPMHDDTQLV